MSTSHGLRARSELVVTLAALAVLLPGYCRAQSAPLPLPANPEEICARAALWNITTSDNTCARSMNDLSADEECCKVLYEAYGAESTAPTRNCFCYGPYFTSLLTLQGISYAIFPLPYLNECAGFGYPIPYYTPGVPGICDGVDPNAPVPASELAAEEADVPEPLYPRSFGRWVRDLSYDPWGAFFFSISIMGAVGFCLMSWPFIFDLSMDIRDLWNRRVKKNA